MAGETIYTVELQAWDRASGSLVRLYFATRGFTTEPTDSPPNTFFDGRLTQPAACVRDLFSHGTTSGRSRGGYGDVVLNNQDGGIDALLGYGFDGRSVIVREGTLGAAYPSAYRVVSELTAEQCDATQDALTIKVRDRQLDLEAPLQPNKYAGDNELPDGVEGGPDDLLGKPKPRCFGVVKNVPAVLVNPAKLIYQVNDGPIASLDAVYDRGIKLGASLDLWDTLSTAGFGANAVRAMAYGTDENGESYAVLVGDGGDAEWSAGGASLAITHPFTTENLFCVGWGDVDTTPPGTRQAGFIIAGSAGVMALWRNKTNFDSVTSGFGATSIRGVAYSAELDRWVAVGDGGALRSSDDLGQSWTARTSGVATDLLGVLWAAGKFIAYGASGVIRTSTDGITWSGATSGFGSATIRAGTYANGRFVLVGDSNIVSYSFNGTTWIPVTGGLTSEGTSSNARGIYASDGKFVVVGEDESVASSFDAVDWTLHVRTVGGEDWLCVTRIPGGVWLRGGTTGLFAATRGETQYADLAEIQDDTRAPAPGSYLAYLSGGYFRLGAPPAGLITADVTEGATGDDRTAAQIFARLLADPLGAPLVELSRDDLALWDRDNLALHSQEFNNAVWNKSATSVVADAARAPDGSLTADKLVEDTSNATHYVYQSSLTIKPGDPVVGSYFLANAGRFRGRVYVGDIAGATAAVIATFNLVTGTVVGSVVGTGVLHHCSIVPVVGGYRIDVAGWVGSVTSVVLQVNMYDDSGTASYTGDGQKGMYLWQGQLEVGLTASPVIPTAGAAAALASSCGLWVGPEELSIADALDRLAATLGAWWGIDRTGVVRLQGFTEPLGLPVIALTANDLAAPLERIAVVDESRGLPAWRTTVRYAPNYTVQDTDLAAGVDDERRAFLAHERREAVASDPGTQLAHPLAVEGLEDTLLELEAAAAVEASRRQILRGLKRDRFRLMAPLDAETELVDLGHVVTLTHSRYGFSGGQPARVLRVEPDVAARRLTLEIWR